MVVCIGKIQGGKLHITVDVTAFGKGKHVAESGKMVGPYALIEVADYKWCPVRQDLITLEECAAEKNFAVLDCLTCEEY